MNVVFYDGHCGVCDALVSFLLPRAPKAGLLFAPLQGGTYRSLAERHSRLAGVDSVVFVEGLGEGSAERVYVESRAVIEILRHLGGAWRLIEGLGRLTPPLVRDFLYRRFASLRYKLAQRRDTCRIPAPEERALLMD